MKDETGGHAVRYDVHRGRFERNGREAAGGAIFSPMFHEKWGIPCVFRVISFEFPVFWGRIPCILGG